VNTVASLVPQTLTAPPDAAELFTKAQSVMRGAAPRMSRAPVLSTNPVRTAPLDVTGPIRQPHLNDSTTPEHRGSGHEVTPGPHPGEPRPPAPDRGAAPLRQAAAAEADRSRTLGAAVEDLGRVGEVARHSEARDRDPLASQGLPALLAMEEPRTRAAQGLCRDPGLAPADVPGQPALGGTEDSRRASETRHRDQPGRGLQVHGAAAEAALPDLAGIPEEPRPGHRLGRLLHGPHGDLPGALRLRRPGQSQTGHPPLQRNRLADGGLGGAADARGVPVGYGTAIPDPGSRWSLRGRFHSSHEVHGDQASADLAAESLAESLCGAGDWLDPQGVSRSCDHPERAASAASAPGVHPLLPWFPNTSWIGQGLPAPKASGATAPRRDPRHVHGRRAASSLLPMRCLTGEPAGQPGIWVPMDSSAVLRSRGAEPAQPSRQSVPELLLIRCPGHGRRR